MIEVALFGTVTTAPVRRVSAAGKPWLSIGVRCGSGDDQQWAWLSVFGDDVDALHGKVHAGTRLYAEGKLTVGSYERGESGGRRSTLHAHTAVHRRSGGRSLRSRVLPGSSPTRR